VKLLDHPLLLKLAKYKGICPHFPYLPYPTAINFNENQEKFEEFSSVHTTQRPKPEKFHTNKLDMTNIESQNGMLIPQKVLLKLDLT
jgi:hypothetical protein